MMWMFVFSLITATNGVKYFLAVESITSHRASKLNSVNINLESPTDRFQKLTFNLLDIETGTRNLVHEPYDGDSIYGSIEMGDIKNAIAKISIRKNLQTETISCLSSTRQTEFLLRCDGIFIKIYYRPASEHILEEYYDMELKGYLGIKLSDFVTKQDVSIYAGIKKLYSISSKKSPVIIFPLYYTNNVKAQFLKNIFISNLRNQAINGKNAYPMYTWNPNQNDPQEYTINFKIVYFTKNKNSNFESITMASFCFREQEYDNICNIGFAKSRFSTYNLYKTPIDLKLAHKTKNNIFVQIIFRVETRFIINPNLNIINFVLNQEFICAGQSFLICQDIHCFLFLSDHSDLKNKNAAISAQVDQKAGLCSYSDYVCLKQSKKLEINPRSSNIVDIPLNQNDEFLLFFAVKGLEIYPLSMKKNSKNVILKQKYKFMHGSKKDVFYKFIFKSEPTNVSIREIFDEEMCKDSFYFRLFFAFQVTSILVMVLWLTIFIPLLYLVIKIIMRRMEIAKRREMFRTNKYFKDV